MADQETLSYYDLYAVFTTGGTPPVHLSTDLPADSIVGSFEITPNSLGVVYSVWNPILEKRNLYAVPTIGGTQIALTDIPDGRGVQLFDLLPNNLGVIYTADVVLEDIYELYLVSTLGGSSYHLNGPLVNGGVVMSFAISSDSLNVVYVADQDMDDKQEMYVSFEGFGVYLPIVER